MPTINSTHLRDDAATEALGYDPLHATYVELDRQASVIALGVGLFLGLCLRNKRWDTRSAVGNKWEGAALVVATMYTTALQQDQHVCCSSSSLARMLGCC